MNILLLGTHLNVGGIPRYLISLASELAHQGNKVVVGTGGGKWEDSLEEKNIKHLTLNILTKSELSPKVWHSAKQLKRFLAYTPIDVIHANTRVTQVLTEILSRQVGIPYVTTCHGFYRRRLGRRLFPCWGKKVIAISEMVRQHLLKDFEVPKEKVRMIPNGVDLDRFRPIPREEKRLRREELHLPTEGKIVGSVSRLVQVKGHHELLRAVALLRKEYPDLALVLVGEGEAKPHLEKLAKSLGIAQHVFFVGTVENPVPYISALDIFVHPSEWNEGFGLAPAEAMACGIPVIACKGEKGGMRMFITDKESGTLLPGNDPRRLEGAIREFLKDPRFSERVGQKGRQVIAEKFSVGRMAKEIFQVYQEVFD